MDLKKSYYDDEGNELNILQMVALEPEWASNRIQEGEKSVIKAIKQQAEIDELVDTLEMVYNNSFRQPDGMWKIMFSDQGRMNLKTLIAKNKGE